MPLLLKQQTWKEYQQSPPEVGQISYIVDKNLYCHRHSFGTIVYSTQYGAAPVELTQLRSIQNTLIQGIYLVDEQQKPVMYYFDGAVTWKRLTSPQTVFQDEQGSYLLLGATKLYEQDVQKLLKLVRT